MRISSLGFFVQQAGISLRRNPGMSAASIITMAFCLIILGASLLIILNTNQLVNNLESSVEVVAYAKADVKAETLPKLEKRLQEVPGVKTVVFVSKAEGLEELKRRFGNNANLLGSLGERNPLPDAFHIQMVDPQQVAAVAEQIGSWPELERVRYGQGIVERLFTVTDWIKTISISIMGFLALTAVFLIATTIRLAMNSRQTEISIMKYVGASNRFIRWPFFLEGMFLGFCGALLAVAALASSYLSLIKNLNLTLAFLPLVQDPALLGMIFGGLLLIGIFLGAAGTLFSIYRFMDV